MSELPKERVQNAFEPHNDVFEGSSFVDGLVLLEETRFELVADRSVDLSDQVLTPLKLEVLFDRLVVGLLHTSELIELLW